MTKGNIEDIYPLSPMQQGMLFHALLSPGSEMYVEQTNATLRGDVNVEAFRRAWQRVLDRNPILRTAFVWEGVDEPLQVVHRRVELPLDVQDWQDLSAEGFDARLAAFCRDQRRLGFDLSEAPLLRLTLIRRAQDAWELIWTHHHTLLDGWSLPILLREVFTLYDAFSNGKPFALPASRPYRDYIRYLKEKREADAEAFWREMLAGYHGPPSLGIEKPTTAETGAGDAERNGEQELWLSEESNSILQGLAQSRQLTINTLVAAAWGLLLSRYSQSPDVIFGATVSGRPTDLRNAEGMVGLFINTLPVRMRVDEQQQLGEWLSAFQDRQAELRQYEHTPLVQIQGWSEVPRDTPLFETLMVYENYPTDRALARQLGPQGMERGGQGASTLRIAAVTSFEQTNYPLTFVSSSGSALLLKISYDRSRYADATISRMLGHLRTLLEAMPSRLEQPVGAMPLLTEAEVGQLLQQWHGAVGVQPGPQQTVSELVAARATLSPEAMAVVWESGGPAARDVRSMSYGELNQRANQISNRLRSLGAAPGTIAALYMDRSPQLIAAFLGVMKSGAAYLPLDPAYPTERISTMLADSGAALLVTQPHLLNGLRAALPSSDRQVHVLSLDDTWEELVAEPDSEPTPPPAPPPAPDDPAYLIYTSGSTGTPNGVIIPNRALSNHSPAIVDLYDLKSGDRMLQYISPSFDAAGEEVWPPLVSGATIVLPGEERDLLGEPLAAFCERLGITHLHLPSPVWHQWCDDLSANARRMDLPLKTLVVGGESPSPSRLQAWNGMLKAPCRFINAYGPTETTITAALYTTPSDNRPPEPIPVGRPIANVQVRVVDRQMRWLPEGVPGELLIGGAGVALGYHNRPELTAERFVDLPLHEPLADLGRGSRKEAPGQPETRWRFYRTGDVVRWFHDRGLVFAGRADDQVKIRGHRVEPGEVEAAIASLPGVAQAAVVGLKRIDGTARLVAYVVLNDAVADSGMLADQLRRRVPEAMVPEAWVTLPELPLTPSGKLDRRRLPAPETKGPERVAPRALSPDEELLVGLFATLLRAENVGADDNFFDLGGHSLLATRLISRIHETFGVEMPLRALFDTPTVSGMVRAIATCRGGDSVAAAPPIDRIPRGSDGLPLSPPLLSFGQQRLWFLDQLEPGLLSYNTPAALRMEGELNLDALRYAFNEIVRRHEVLRTTFGMQQGVPVQVVARQRAVEIPVEDLTGIADAAEREVAGLRLAGIEARQPFDLARDLLLRVRLFKLGAHDHLGVITVHHIAADGWSLGILVDELSTLYGAYGDNGHPDVSPLPVLPLQYVDYAEWQRRWLEGDRRPGSGDNDPEGAELRRSAVVPPPSPLQAQLDYWKEQLAGLPPRLDLPTDRPRPAIQSSNGSAVSFRLSGGLLKKLRLLARQEDVTLYMVLLAGYQSLLARYSGQTDLAVGSVVASRVRPELERLIGFFVNTLVFRTKFDDKPTFRQLLGRVRETALGAYAHQGVPFEMLVDAVQPRRELSHTPLFQAALSLQNLPKPARHLPGLRLRAVEIDRGTAQFDMLLTFSELDDGLGASWEFNTDLFDRTTIERMARNLDALLAAAVIDPEQWVAELPVMSDAERELVVDVWNRTATPFADDMTIHALIEAWAKLTPDGIAVEFVDALGPRPFSENLRYSELNARANQLAHALRARGVGPNVLVGLATERSLNMVVGILGILKAGGAYLPLDPNYPADRLSFMIADAGIRILLTQRRLSEAVGTPFLSDGPPPQQTSTPAGTTALEIVQLDNAPEIFGVQTTSGNPAPSATADDLAYCIYTSGSTGRPKGVLLRHRGLCNLADVQAASFDIKPGKRVLQFSAFSFDASVWETVMALRSGATLVLARQETLASGPDLLQLLQAAHITTVTLPPSLLAVLEPADLPELETVIAAGERCTNEIMQQWAKGRRFYNAYGPTETTVCATMQRCNFAETWVFGGPPIGKPISNFRCFVVDANLQPLPIGVPGELLLGGVGVAKGYLNRPELTAERFITVPDYSTTPAAQLGELLRRTNPKSPTKLPGFSRLYRTGDLVRWLPEGALEFLGRIDDQVKVRGFRIELGEIEAVLREHPLVRDAAVTVRGDLLVGYVIPAETDDDARVELVSAPGLSVSLRTHLRRRLPEYMVPAVFVSLEAFPLSPAGKVDRRALPAPDQALRETSAGFVAPRTPLEEELAGLCAELLDLERVGVDDNFFELGGHSLLATRLIARLRDRYHVELPLRTLFERPTVAGLAQALQELQSSAASATPRAPAITPRSRDARRMSRSAISGDLSADPSGETGKRGEGAA